MIKDIIFERRTIRKYKDKKVDEDTLKNILKYSLMGPSYANSRPVQFIVIDDKSILEKLSKIEMFGTNYLKDVPEIILVMADRTISEDTWIEECTIVTTYIQLLAQEKGLNTSWVSVKDGKTQDDVDVQDYLKNLLNIPDNFSVFALVPIGYGDEEKEERADFDVSPKIHFNKF